MWNPRGQTRNWEGVPRGNVKELMQQQSGKDWVQGRVRIVRAERERGKGYLVRKSIRGNGRAANEEIPDLDESCSGASHSIVADERQEVTLRAQRIHD